MTIKAFNYDRLRFGRRMAEGITVHAATGTESLEKATELLLIHYPRTDTIRFADNEPCWCGCHVCWPTQLAS